MKRTQPEPAGSRPLTAETYPLIDVWRFIFAVMIIWGHNPLLYRFKEYKELAFWSTVPLNIVVPFFLIVSAYFFFRKIDSLDDPQLKRRAFARYMQHLVKVWLTWSAIYAVKALAEYLLEPSMSIGDALLFYPLQLIVGGIEEHLWFLPALIVGVALAYYFLNKRRLPLRTVLTLAMILLAVGLLGNSYWFLLPPAWQQPYLALTEWTRGTRNGLFYGFPFVTIGVLLARRQARRAPRPARSRLWLVLGASIILMVGEHILEARYGWIRVDNVDMWLSQIPMAVSAFYLMLQPGPINRPGQRFFRDSSLTIYLVHPLVIFLVRLGLPLAGVSFRRENLLPYYLVSVALTLLVAYGHFYWKEQRRQQSAGSH